MKDYRTFIRDYFYSQEDEDDTEDDAGTTTEPTGSLSKSNILNNTPHISYSIYSPWLNIKLFSPTDTTVGIPSFINIMVKSNGASAVVGIKDA